MADFSAGDLGWDIGALLGSLVIAYAVCWLLGRHRPKDSVWFGRALVDGVLFPLLALALTYIARIVLDDFHRVPLLRIATPILLSLAGIRLLARVLTVVFPASGLARAAERLFSWVAWLAAVLWILGLLPAVKAEMQGIQFAFGKSTINLLDVVQGVLSLGVVLVVALWISATVERKLLRQNIHDLSLRKVASNIMRAVLLLVGFLFALSAVGVDLTALSVLGGAIGVGLGFGLQKLASNYVSGFVILFERSLRIGDTVRVDGFEGVVADIKTRYTLIRAGNGRESIVPNEKLITERIENLSLDDPRLLVTVDIGIGYDSDVDVAQALLLEAALAEATVLKEPAPVCRMQRFGPDALEFQLSFWVGEPAAQGKARSDVSLGILQRLRAAGIDIPYPQRVVRVEGPVVMRGQGQPGPQGQLGSQAPAGE
ncbi:MAG: putative small-conductance mechanosensitive ion channel [Ramlibacter sp.]|uniref:mechanosensitive ion channel family protein n=1 Tax=Ramlibacter sp. TaxID=1917967 RepID=UPI0026294F59|nr:mechanosensitive ion channel domain-containing protein [Ramlibacter sp.]MDB5753231.1 putative small-conductance mechanosensitive ion channel [Ramlibacter sp.]